MSETRTQRTVRKQIELATADLRAFAREFLDWSELCAGLFATEGGEELEDDEGWQGLVAMARQALKAEPKEAMT